MTFLKSIASILTAEVKLSGLHVTQEEVPDAGPSIPQLDELLVDETRGLSLDTYAKDFDTVSRRHIFELRYAAYGETSNMVCATLKATRPGAARPLINNAMATMIDLGGRSIASALLVLDGKEGLSADALFNVELATLRKTYGLRICELSNLLVNRENKSRRALGAMFHVIYLYARQARQMKVMVVQVLTTQMHLLEQLMGFKAIATRGQHTLMSLELDFIKREQRLWGGSKESAVNPSFLLYPFFFPSSDEPGLLFRVLEHLGADGK